MRPFDRSECDRHRVHRTVLGGLAALMLLAACSSIPPPREQLAVSKAAVERASGPAAAESPVELAMARDKLERANLAMGRKDYIDAGRLAEQAEADANLAEARARSMRSAAALQEVRDGIRMLREEMGRRVRS
jgi:Domain of unknown function (DUF4398)